MAARSFSVVMVTMENAPGNGLRVSSPDLPGLAISGRDRRTVIDAIVPAIHAILEHRGDRDIAVHPVRPLVDALAPSRRRRRTSDFAGTYSAQFVIEVTR